MGKKFKLFCRNSVDDLVDSVIFDIPPQRGFSKRKLKKRVLGYFGTANWNSILSRPNDGNVIGVGRQSWVFLSPEISEAAGSLTSTYRVVKTTFKS